MKLPFAALLSRFLNSTLRTTPYFRVSRTRFLKAIICGVAVVFAAPSFSAAQSEMDSAAARSRVMAFETAWGLAEKTKDAKALDALLDNSLTYTDYDGSLKTKSDFLAGVKAAAHTPEEETAESMSAQIYGDTAVVVGVYRVRGIDRGKPYLRRGRFTDTWVSRKGNWVCVASQFTLINH